MRRYFITGTDTDCGKTYVTKCLTNYFSHAVAIKPVASGCELRDGRLVSSDAEQLQTVSGYDLDFINPWRLKSPISPHIAAKEDGEFLSASAIAQYCLNLVPPGIDRLFVEGAGGLLVPLNDEETWIDFLKLTRFPVIFVVGMKLGCINHALLTEMALRHYNISCIGWIANCIDPNMLALAENIDTLRAKLKIPFLGLLPFGGKLSQMNFL